MVLGRDSLHIGTNAVLGRSLHLIRKLRHDLRFFAMRKWGIQHTDVEVTMLSNLASIMPTGFIHPRRVGMMRECSPGE